jgi:serine/threonine-protein kinase
MAAVATDRNLLFGLLALQNGLIDQAQLVAAFRAWTRDKARALADHLDALGHLNGAERAAVEAMAALHSRRFGEVEHSLAAILVDPSTCERLSRLGDPELEGTMAHVRSPSIVPDGQAEPDRTSTHSLGPTVGDGQRFRVLRPHARGGLGAVYVALDTELHREVALKQILDRHADDPVSRQRFLLEAEITGGLEHPGIVPVYGMGTYGDGRPYYAMRFIRGETLREAIERFHADAVLRRDHGRWSLDLHKLLRRFTDVCNAVDYAHSRGVLHRDIKPGNIIVGKHGETLVVDWGLAKVTGQSDASAGEQTLRPSSGSGSAETLPGSALGTPAYMSPEQARGEIEQLEPRSDVYSLGATLYCLLTGKSPQEGNDVGDILSKVKRSEFAPPRQLDPTIDKALEAVCLKAMALKPEDRYASCRALADDIERWMADEPVSAWREPRTRTLTRWMNRHRTGVTGTAAAALAGVVGLVAVLGVQATANARLSESLGRETQANAELKRSRAAVLARYDMAVEAIKTFHTGVSQDFLVKQDQFKELRDRLLRSAADFYGRLGASLGQETDLASRQALAASNYELAELTAKVGRKEDALASHRAVLAAREALTAELGDAAASKADVARSLTAVASLLEATGKTDEAVATCRRAESLLAGLVGSEPSIRAALADCRSQLGWLLFGEGLLAEALATYRLSQVEQEALAAAPGASSDHRRALADTAFRIGNLLNQTGKLAEAEAEYHAALTLYQKLADDNRAVSEFRSRLAACHSNRGWVLSQLGKPSEAEAELRKAVAIQRRLADDNPAISEFRSRLASSHIALGALMSDRGKPSEAEAEWRGAMELFQKLADDNPAAIDFRYRLAVARHNLAQVLSQTGNTPGAEAAYRSSAADFQKAVDDNPAVPDYLLGLASALNNLSAIIQPLGRAAEARDISDRAITLGERLVRRSPTSELYRRHLAISFRVRGLARRDLGDRAGAAADARRALGLYDGLSSRSGEEWFETANCRALLASLGGVADSTVTAAGQSDADAAMELLRKALAMGFHNLDEIRDNPGLDILRSRPDFQLFIMDVAMPVDPFDRAD